MVIVLGGGYAGILTASRLQAAGLAVTLVNASDHFVERPRLHQLAAGEALAPIPIRGLWSGEFVEGWVTAIRPESNQVEVATTGGTQRLEYQQLVVALGSHTDTSLLPGAAEFCYTLDQESARRLGENLPEEGTVMVIGAGLTGIEMATEMAEQHPHLQVLLVSSHPLGQDLAPTAARYLQAQLDRLNIRTLSGRAERVQANRLLVNGQWHPFDAAVYCGGFRACPLPQEADLQVNSRGQLLTDAYLRSLSHPNIWAVGDVAAPPNAPRMACATALPMAEKAAQNLIAHTRNRPLKRYQHTYTGRCLSLGRKAGILQLTRTDDRPLPLYFWGGVAANLKEKVLGTLAVGTLRRARPR